MKSYFIIEELTSSRTAKENKIDNTPSPEIIKNLQELINFLNPLREAWGKPIIVNSGYRCPKLNSLLKGSATSAHLYGFAVDIVPKDMRDWDRFVEFVKEYLKDKQFDQLILETSGTSK